MDIVSAETIAAIDMFTGLNTAEFAGYRETRDFLSRFQRWWVIHDIGSTYQHIRQCFEDKKPFTDVDDARLIWLVEDFIP